MVRILKRANSALKPLHALRLGAFPASSQHPRIPTPLDPSRVPTQPFVYPGMLIQHDNYRLMREVCALKHFSINTEKTYTHLAGPLRFLSQGPKAQSPHGSKQDGSLPDAYGLAWFSSQVAELPQIEGADEARRLTWTKSRPPLGVVASNQREPRSGTTPLRKPFVPSWPDDSHGHSPYRYMQRKAVHKSSPESAPGKRSLC